MRKISLAQKRKNNIFQLNLLILILVFLLSIIEFSNAMESTSPLQMNIIGGSKEDINQTELSLTIKNNSKIPIKLDSRLLNQIMLCHIYDKFGKEVLKVPPPVPISFNESLAISLIAQQEIIISIELYNLTHDELLKPPYKIICCYDTSQSSYGENIDIWIGKICSNEFIIKKLR